MFEPPVASSAICSRVIDGGIDRDQVLRPGLQHLPEPCPVIAHHLAGKRHAGVAGRVAGFCRLMIFIGDARRRDAATACADAGRRGLIPIKARQRRGFLCFYQSPPPGAWRPTPPPPPPPPPTPAPPNRPPPSHPPPL